MIFKKLSLEEKFGQMIMLGLDTYEINTEIINIIRDFKIGGVVLYKKNYTSLETMTKFINKLKIINSINKLPLFIAIDQENGVVNRLPKDVLNMPGALKQSLANNMKVNEAINRLTTSILDSVGVNMNFAPVLDLKNNNKVNNKRSYGNNVDTVLKHALPFMKTMQKSKIIPVVKHFPGHGATDKDSHFTMPIINDVNSLEEKDLQVFKKAFASGADAVMVGHLRIKGMGLKPATLNKDIISKYLPDYNGLIITDDLKMNVLKYVYGTKKCIEQSINAGCNICMVKYNKGDYKVYKKLLRMVKFCELDPVHINDSAKKIVKMKKKYGITAKENNENIDVSKINQEITIINDIINKELGEIK